MTDKIKLFDQVSLVIPVRNEAKFIEKCIQSVLKQDYPLEKMEALLIDGLSNDQTKEIIKKYNKEYPSTIKYFENSKKTVPYAMNIGIRNAAGHYIIRLDGHAEYPDNYVSKCIATLKRTGADNVGGLLMTRGSGTVGRAYAKVLSSVFGVGNASFRINASSGFVDTVPFGAFKRSTFIKYGFYDERLTRRQDYELNYRIRKKGGKIYLDSDIKLVYHCRSTIPGILEQSYQKGKWNIITAKMSLGTMSLRHLIPFIFVLSLLLLPILAFFVPFFKWLLLTELAAYLLLSVIFSFKLADGFKEAILIFLLYPLNHLAYGFGSIAGLKYNPKQAIIEDSESYPS
ncbi:MAG: glycosyltransferase family 2 protein [Firmicutes bacterium]|nr:glycosyltransferase family 2 protein [Bacillota bacterium]